MTIEQVGLILSIVLFILLVFNFYFLLKESMLSNSKKLLDTVPFHFKDNKKPYLIEAINKYIDLLISYGGPKDSRDTFFKEVKRYSVYALIVVLLGFLFNNNLFFLVGLWVVCSPAINRWSKRRKDTVRFRDDFFQALFYMILFINGGMSVYHAIIEANSLIDDTSPLKTSLNKIITQYNLTRGNFVSLFKILAEDFDIQEVNYFITSVETSYNKGVSISDSLTDQLSYIRKNRNFYFKGIAGSIGNKLTPLMLAFTMIPLLMILAIPPLLEALETMSGGPVGLP